MTNLFTITISNPDNLKIVPGWYVSVSNNGLKVHGLGKISSSPFVHHLRDGVDWLYAGAVALVPTKREVVHNSENDSTPWTEYINEEEAKLLATPDKNIYYRIFLPVEMKISQDFEILVDTMVENPCKARAFDRMLIARRPDESPLLVDNNGTLCVSPI